MPYSAKQNKVFRALEHGWDPPEEAGLGSLEKLGQAKLKKMAHEGVKPDLPKRKARKR